MGWITPLLSATFGLSALMGFAGVLLSVMNTAL